MAGNVYAVSREGVTALKTMSAAVVSAADEINKVSKAIKIVVDENHDKLGPHEKTIVEVVEEIETLIRDASEPVEDISGTLNDVADEYNDIIGDDRIKDAGGN